MRIEFEKAANETPEFRAITQEQQDARAELFSSVLKILREPSLLGISEEQATQFTNILLEFCLTGKFEGIIQPINPPKKPRAHKTRQK
jgi:hypothetical protein